MRIFVTGGGGFLGQKIVEMLLARGDQVRVFARGEYPELARLGAELHRGDIRDPSAVSQALVGGFDAVVHTAAVAGIWGDWDFFYKTNTVGTTNVIQACRIHNVGRLVFTSSPSVTFDGAPQENVSEESAPYPTNWLAHYPHTKALAEQAVLAANEPGKLLTCALRPHLIWGPGDTQLVPRLIRRSIAGKLRRVGDGQNLIDMIYVDNAAEAHLLALDALQQNAPICGRAYFLSQGKPVKCWQWIDELLALADQPPVRKSVSVNVAWAIGAALERIYSIFNMKGEPPMTRFLAAQLGCAHYFDISRSKNDFGYSPTISTAEGMKRLGEWMRNRIV